MTNSKQSLSVEELQQRIAVLEDLLETAYRKTDQARAESDKADDEALELKRAMLDMRFKHSGGDAKLVREFKARADAAEAELAALRSRSPLEDNSNG